MSDSKKLDLLREELARRKKLEYPVDFQPYTNRDGSESWQQKAQRLLCDPTTFQILAVCSNGSGKTAMCVYLALSILYGKNPVCDLWPGEPTYVHIVTESFGKQKETIQEKMAEITDFVFNSMGYCSDPKIKIYRHSGVIKEIHNISNNHRIKFSSAQEGQKGLVGIEPHLLILDEPIGQDAYDELIGRIRKPNARFLMCCTPLNSDHAWIVYRAKELLELEKAGKPVPGKYVLQSRAVDNPYFPLAQIENWKNEWGEEDIRYRVRALGELEILDGLVMPDLSKNIVPDHYTPEYARGMDSENEYIWLEAADYGSYDGTLIIWAKLYNNGEVVVEREWYAKENTSLRDWVSAYRKGREDCNMPIQYIQTDIGTQIKLWKNHDSVYRKPHNSIADGAELEKSDKSSGLKLKHLFAQNEIYIMQSPKTNIEFSLTIVNSLFKDGKLKIKERCFNLIENGRKHVYRTNEKTGKSDTKSRYDIAMDVLRYLVQSPAMREVIQSYVKSEEYKFKIIKEREIKQKEYQEYRNIYPNSI